MLNVCKFSYLQLTVYSPIDQQIFVSDKKWNRWIWREEMARMIDDVKPDIVLCPDQDEIFDRLIIDDVEKFYQGDADINYNLFNLDFTYIWNFAPGSQISVMWKNVIVKKRGH